MIETADLQAIVDDIREILCADADPKLDALGAVQTAYVAAIEHVNERLSECERLLLKGNRAEALRLCDIEPPLMEVVGILDFSEQEQWADYVTQFGLSPPPLLEIELAAELNEAYTAEEPVAGLMRLHRLYALARAPLRRRIEVLRKLSAAERGNTVWQEDVRNFEKARHAQVGDELEAAVKGANLAALAALEREACEPDWLISPPKGTIEKIKQAHTRLRVAQARRELRDVERELLDAYSSLDTAQGSTLRARWNKLLAISDLPPDDPLLELAAPALAWLAEEDRKTDELAEHRAGIAALERALDDGLPRLELERLSRLATQHARELPTPLERRLFERLRYLGVQEGRRAKILIMSIVAGVLVAAGVTTAAIVQQSRSRERAAYVANLAKLIEDEKLPEADKYLDDIEQRAPHVYADPVVQKLRGDLQSAESREAGRQTQWRQALDAAHAGGIEVASWESLPSAQADIKRAAGLAKTGEEHAEVKRLERRIHEKQTALQSAVDTEFMGKLDDFKARVSELKADDVDGNTELRRAAALLQAQPHVTFEIKSQVDPLLAKLKMLENSFLTAQRETAAIESLSRIASLDEYRVALENYAAAFPGTKRAHDFERVAKKEFDAVKGLEAWESFVARWRALDFAHLEPPQAAALVGETAGVLDKYKDHPAAVDLEPLLAHLRAIAKRIDGAGKSIAAKLNDPLNNPTVANLFMLRTDKNERYYCQEEPHLKKDHWEVHYIKGFDLNKGHRLVPRGDVVNSSVTDSRAWIAPQSTFSRTALLQLDKLDGGNWDETFVAMFAALYHNRQMEPLLKLQLMALVLDVAREGSAPLANAFAKHTDLINGGQFDPALNWLDPANPEAKQARLKADAILERMESPKAAAAKAAQYAADVKKPLLRPAHRWIGWLARDKAGKWICVGSHRNREWETGTGPLLVLDVGSEAGSARLAKIGSVKAGKFVVVAVQDSAHVEGRPVYLEIAADDVAVTSN